MINRELIRIKIVQLTYAYYQNGSNNLTNAENNLMYSLSKAYALYNYLLMLIVAISKEMRHRVEVGANRAKREGNEPPSTKFVDNRFALQLENNNALLDYADEQKLSWNDDVEFVRKLCNIIEQSQIYQEYMASDDENSTRRSYKTMRTSMHCSRRKAYTGTTTRRLSTPSCSRPSSVSTPRQERSRNCCPNTTTTRTRSLPANSSGPPFSMPTSISAI